jgi:hypothetical protein
MSSDNQPAFRVYSVIARDGKDDYWLNIGLAFPHNDGKGFNVMLQALPLNAKLVLREAAEERSSRQRASAMIVRTAASRLAGISSRQTLAEPGGRSLSFKSPATCGVFISRSRFSASE